ncbi:hypothetical protein DPMN_139391 [Dreissena polymorpha]|uniref:Ig-like domain-containing protein n=1 Tax=Dreissena polymorpha TaxID=45954 RepID=A0A9D4G5V9_DREPO|nr:hypothetical protein DPMN_139391 [Dreissena polymorpha]
MSVRLTPGVQLMSVFENATTTNFTCASSIGRPTPIIHWYLDNYSSDNFTDDVDITSHSTNSTSGDMTISSCILVPSMYYHGQRIYCNAMNGYGRIIADFTPLINILRKC